MKTLIKRFSKQTLSVILAAVMVVTSATIGTVTASAWNINANCIIYYLDTDSWNASNMYYWGSNWSNNKDLIKIPNTKVYYSKESSAWTNLTGFKFRSDSSWTKQTNGNIEMNITGNTIFKGTDATPDKDTTHINSTAKVTTMISTDGGKTYAESKDSDIYTKISGYTIDSDSTDSTTVNAETNTSSTAVIYPAFGSDVTYTANKGTGTFKGFSTTKSSTLPSSLKTDSSITVTNSKTGGTDMIQYYAYYIKSTTFTGLSVAANPTTGGNVTISAVSTTDSVNVTADANTGYIFGGWSSDNGTFGSPTAANTTFMPNANNAVAIANFNKSIYTYKDVSDASQGTVILKRNASSSPSNGYSIDDELTFEAYPNTGYVLDHIEYSTDGGVNWTEGTSVSSVTAEMCENDRIQVKGIFKVQSYNLIKDVDITNGVIGFYSDSECTKEITKAEYNSTVYVKCIPLTGYVTSSVKYGLTDASKVSDYVYKFSMPSVNTTVTATFTEILNKITIKAEPSDAGSLTESSTNAGVITTGTAEVKKINDSYTFAGWIIPEGVTLVNCTANDKKITFNATQAATVTAAFVAKPTYAINVEATPDVGGTVSVSPEAAYEGQTVTVTAAPKSGYKLKSLVVKDSNGKVITVSNNTFSMPSNSVSINVIFEELSTVTLTIRSDINGTLKVNNSTHSSASGQITNGQKTIQVYEGDNLTFTATPNNGYDINVLTVNSNKYFSSTASYTVETKDISAEATFSKQSSNWYYEGYDSTNTQVLTDKPMLTGTYNGQEYYYYRVSRDDDNKQLFTIKNSGVASARYVYLNKKNVGWSNSETRVYFYNSSGDVKTAWPGESMTTYSGSGDGDLRCEIPSNATGCIFSKNGSDQTIDIDFTKGTLTSGAYYLNANDKTNGKYNVYEWKAAPKDAGIGTDSVEYMWNSPVTSGVNGVFNEADQYRFGGNINLYNYNSYGKAHISTSDSSMNGVSDYYILVYLPNTNYGMINNQSANNNTDHIIVVASTDRPEFVTNTKINVYAKDGTLRAGTANNKFASIATTSVAASEYVTVAANRVSVASDCTYQTAQATKGKLIEIETKITDTAAASKYYVKGWCINGVTYGILSQSAGKSHTSNTYSLKYIIPEDEDAFALEITPIYFLKDDSDTVTFTVEGFDANVQKDWGSTISVYAYYTPSNTESFGSYPGQPLVNDQGKYYIQVPKSDGANAIQGITLTNYYLDNVHTDVLKISTENRQTYDYDDFVKIISEKHNPQNIVFSFKYRHGDNYSDNYGETRDTSDQGSSIPSSANLKNGWEMLTDYFDNNVDIFGNKLIGDAAKATISSSDVLQIVSNGYIDNYQGYYATEWTVYTSDGKKIATIPSSALLLNKADNCDLEKYNPSSVPNQNKLQTYKSAYKALESYKGKAAKITYEKDVNRGTSVNGNKNNESALRCDGRWYYTTTNDFVRSNIVIEYDDDNSGTYKRDIFPNQTDDYTVHTGEHTGCSAYFTNEAFNGKIRSDLINIDANSDFTFIAKTAGEYMFAGWYRLKEGTEHKITSSNIGASSMTSSDTYIAKFRKVTLGSLNISHQLLSTSSGTGTTYLSVTVKDNEGNILNTPVESTTDIHLSDKYITTEHGDYTITVKLRTVADGEDKFKDFTVNRDDSVFFGGTTEGAGTGEAFREFSFRVSDLFIKTTQDVTSLIYYSDLNKTEYDYVIKYNYISRLWDSQAYTVRGTFTSEEYSKYIKDGKITSDFIAKKAPYEDNFMQSITWNIDDATTTKIDKTDGGAIFNVNVTSSKEDGLVCNANIRIPYEYDLNDKNFKPKNVDENGAAKKEDSEDVALTTTYGGWFTTNEQQNSDYFIQAAAKLSDNGTLRNFSYWKISTMSDNKFVAKCYSRYFNFSAYQNYNVEAIYGDEDTRLSDFSTTITFLENSRNQWNENDKGSCPNDWTSADRIFTDFAISYNYNFNNLKEYSDKNVKIGMVIQRLGELDTTTTGEVITDTEIYSDKYNHSEESAAETIAKYVLSGNKADKDGLTLLNCKIASNNDQTFGTNLSETIDNKNRLQYYYGWDNFTEANRMNVYRAYSYIMVEESDGWHIAVSEVPAYFNMYETAIK